MNWWGASTPNVEDAPQRPVRVSIRTLIAVIEQTLFDGFARESLCVALVPHPDLPPSARPNVPRSG